MSEIDWGVYLDAVAQAIDLPIAAADRDLVIATLRQTALVAAPLLSFPLGDADGDAAAIFCPEGP
jgi:hypothetical protein